MADSPYKSTHLQNTLVQIMANIKFDQELFQLLAKQEQPNLIIQRIQAIIEEIVLSQQTQELLNENAQLMKKIQILTNQTNNDSKRGVDASQESYWKHEYLDVKKKLDEQNIEVEYLQKENKSLRKQLEETERVIDELQGEMMSTSQKLELMENKLGDQKQNLVDEFEENLNSIQDKYEAKIKELQHQQEQARLQDQYKALEFEKILEEYNDVINQLKQERDEAVQQVEALNKEIPKPKEEPLRFEKENSAIKRNYQLLSDDYQQLQKQLVELKKITEQCKLEKQISDKRVKDIKQQLDNQLKSKRDVDTVQKTLEKQNSDLHGQIKQLKREIDDQKKTIKNSKYKFKIRFEDLKQKLNQGFLSIFQSIRLERENLKLEMLKDMDILYEQLHNIVLGIIQDIWRIQKKCMEHEDEIRQREFSDRAELLRTKLQEHFKSNKEKIEQEFGSNLKTYQNQVVEKENQLQSQKEQKNKEISDYQSRIEQLQLYLQESRQQEDVLNMDIANLGLQVQDRDDIIQQQQNKNSDLFEQIQEMKQIITNMENQLENLMALKYNYEQNNQTMEQELINCQKEINSYKKEKLIQAKKEEDLKQSNELLRKQVQTYSDEGQKDQDLLQNYQEQLRELEMDIQVVLGSSSVLKESNQEMQKQLNHMEKRRDFDLQRVLDLEKENQQQKRELLELEGQLRQLKRNESQQRQNNNNKEELDYYPSKANPVVVRSSNTGQKYKNFKHNNQKGFKYNSSKIYEQAILRRIL